MENEVVSLTNARQLKQHGIVQESEYYWKYNVPSLSDGTGSEQRWVLVHGKPTPPAVSAYNLNEIKELFTAYLTVRNLTPKIAVVAKEKETLLTVDSETFSGVNEIEAYANCLLYMIKYQK